MGGSLTYRFDGRSHFRLELSRDVEEESLVSRAASGTGPSAVSQPIPVIGLTRRGVDVGLVD